MSSRILASTLIGPCLAAIQSVVVSVWIRTIASRAACDHGSRLTNAVQPAGVFGSVAFTRFCASVSVPNSAAANSSICRSPNDAGIPAACVLGKLFQSTPANVSMSSAGCP